MDITPTLRNGAVKGAIEEARELVAANDWTVPSATGSATSPHGVKPPPLHDRP